MNCNDQDQSIPHEEEEELTDVSSNAADEETADDSSGEDQEFLLQQLQRARADLENFRRRTLEERAVLRKRTISDVFRTFLPVLDGLCAALKVDSSEPEGVDGVRDGLKLISGKVDMILSELGIEEVATVGEDFDPEIHEAMLKVDQPDARNGEIVGEIEKGYGHRGSHRARIRGGVKCQPTTICAKVAVTASNCSKRSMRSSSVPAPNAEKKNSSAS